MKLIPHSRREWAACLVLPFRTFIVVAAPAVFIWGSELPRHTYVGDVGQSVILGYLLSGAVLVAIGLVELFIKQMREVGTSNLIFGGIGVMIAFLIAPLFASARL